LSKNGVLEKYGVKVLGTPIHGIEITEDRELFKETMTEIGISCPRSEPAYSLEDARRITREIGFPVIIRVASTLGGRGGLEGERPTRHQARQHLWRLARPRQAA